MIFLICGLFFGLLAIASVSHGGIVIAVWWAVPSILFIAAGIKKLAGTDSDDVLEAFRRMQEGGPALHPLNAEEIRRLQEQAKSSGHPLSAEEIRRLQEQAQGRGADSTRARNTGQSKKN